MNEKHPLRFLTSIRFVIERDVSRSRYRAYKLLLWAYTLVWVGTLVYLAMRWGSLGGWKYLVLVPMILGTPALADLAETYRQFRDDIGRRQAAKRHV